MAIVILNDAVTFSLDVFRGNGIRESYSLDSMITEHGFLIPLEMRSFNYLDILDGIQKRVMKAGDKPVPALLITRDYRVYELMLDGAAMTSRRLGYPGIRFYVRDIPTNTQEGILAAYDLSIVAGKAVSGQDLINTMSETVTYYKRPLVTYFIHELADMVKEKYPDKK